MRRGIRSHKYSRKYLLARLLGYQLTSGVIFVVCCLLFLSVYEHRRSLVKVPSNHQQFLRIKDAIQFKVRDNGHVKSKAIYLAIGVTLDGLKEVLGLWIAQTEGAKFWLQVVTELKNRGVTDIFIACVDGLKGFPEAIESVFPRTGVLLCIVHLVRHSLNYVGWKQRKEVARDLKTIYTAATDVEAEQS